MNAVRPDIPAAHQDDHLVRPLTSVQVGREQPLAVRGAHCAVVEFKEQVSDTVSIFVPDVPVSPTGGGGIDWQRGFAGIPLRQVFAQEMGCRQFETLPAGRCVPRTQVGDPHCTIARGPTNGIAPPGDDLSRLTPQTVLLVHTVQIERLSRNMIEQALLALDGSDFLDDLAGWSRPVDGSIMPLSCGDAKHDCNSPGCQQKSSDSHGHIASAQSQCTGCANPGRGSGTTSQLSVSSRDVDRCQGFWWRLEIRPPARVGGPQPTGRAASL